jgi:hypothetical protein
VYKSYSPQYGSFGFGADPGPSDLENLIAGRERKLSDLVDQSVIERLLSGEQHAALPSGAEDVRGYLGPTAENGFGSLLVSFGRLKSVD